MTTQQKRKAERARSQARQRSEQDVVYTQAKPFNRNRFLLQLATVVTIVLALLFGMSIFFKVEDVQISGTVKYDAWAVREASGILDGENLLTLSKARVSSNILSQLPYVDTVRVGIRLPDTVIIQVTELQVVYSIADSEGGWWLIDDTGKVVDTCTAADSEDYTRILGVTLAAPAVGKEAIAYEEPAETLEGGETVPVTVYAKERLEAAVTITQLMEYYGMIGTVATVDVTELEDVRLWYGSRFEMLLGNTQNLEKKVNSLSQAVSQMGPYDTGTLDASFTFWPTEVGYTPFS